MSLEIGQFRGCPPPLRFGWREVFDGVVNRSQVSKMIENRVRFNERVTETFVLSLLGGVSKLLF